MYVLEEIAEMLTANQILDKDFLEVRFMLVEIAAALDRYDRAAENQTNGKPGTDDRLERIYQSLATLADRAGTPDRSERLLNLFTDP